MTEYETAMAAVNELKKVGLTAQQTHDLLNELRDCISDYDTCHGLFDVVMEAASWIDRLEEERKREIAEAEIGDEGYYEYKFRMRQYALENK